MRLCKIGKDDQDAKGLRCGVFGDGRCNGRVRGCFGRFSCNRRISPRMRTGKRSTSPAGAARSLIISTGSRSVHVRSTGRLPRNTCRFPCRTLTVPMCPSGTIAACTTAPIKKPDRADGQNLACSRIWTKTDPDKMILSYAGQTFCNYLNNRKQQAARCIARGLEACL